MNTSSQHTEKQTEGEHSNHFVTEIQGGVRSQLTEGSFRGGRSERVFAARGRKRAEGALDGCVVRVVARG